ncbi:amidase [Gellertiella hungarica]|uniref:Indoleacetamide hydrolase n=1 Tax=Gellertiella hungarica TaxID=1572859 RepID=A0A7W6J2Q5_9HYPH|nr:amidase [Gellertiella hungarica]MBB4062901.1 aspartyl-tRNA(Asn)/glutamyl-tRNA(Gln) amidotransferase subunit A [Gellertiella hungarica]
MTSITTPRSIAQLSVLIQSGALDPRDLARETIAAIRAHPDGAIFLKVTEERALGEAERSQARLREGRSLGPLDGIPLAWKDLFAMEGLANPAGSRILADAAPEARDAAVVERLQRAGMVSVGRVNMSEFAFSGLGINPHFGTPRNPRATDGQRITGGSSSGSAAAVAAGLVPVAIGTDTGGSIRIPAAFTGIVGYKATRGRYPMDGVFPLATSLDSLGPLCRTVQDCILVDAAMRGRVTPDVRAESLFGQDVIVPETVVFDDIEDGVAAAFEAGLLRLEKAGARIRRMAVPAFAAVFRLAAEHGPLVTAEAFALHRERLSGPQAEGMDPRVVVRCRLGEKISTPSYIAILEARARLIAEMESLVGERAILAFPTLPHVAPRIEPLLESDDAFFRMNGQTLRNTLIGNFLDWCGVSLPCGTGEAGMPAGLLLSGLPNRDDRLLGLALSAECALAGP